MEEEFYIQKQEDFLKKFTNPHNNGCVYVHKDVDQTQSDFKDIWDVSVDKAQLGSVVQIMPVLTENDPAYLDLFLGAKNKKCPDIKVDGVFTEIKKPIPELSENKISQCIRNCHKQADHIVIIIEEKFSISRLEKLTKGRFKSHESLEIIEFKVQGTYHIFKRPPWA